MQSTSREEARLMRSVGMGLPSVDKETGRMNRHVQRANDRAVDHGLRHVEATFQVPPRDPASTQPFAADTFVKQVVGRLNEARTQPRRFAEYLKSLEGCFDDRKRFYHPMRRVDAPTQWSEGPAALTAAVAFFTSSQTEAVPALTLDETLGKATQDLVEAGAAQNQADTTSRLERYGEVQFGKVQEVTAYGERSADEVVVRWMVCDGDASRRIRTALLNPVWRVCGVATALHSKEKRMNAVTLCCAFKVKGELPRREIFVEGEKGDIAAAQQQSATTTSTSSSTSSSVKFCSKCGNKRESASDKFCSKCGNAF